MSALQVVAYQTLASMAKIDVIIEQEKNYAQESINAQNAADTAEIYSTDAKVAAEKAKDLKDKSSSVINKIQEKYGN